VTAYRPGDWVILHTGTTHLVGYVEDVDATTRCGLHFRTDESQVTRRHGWDALTCAHCARAATR
jgi:hypothetical protein